MASKYAVRAMNRPKAHNCLVCGAKTFSMFCSLKCTAIDHAKYNCPDCGVHCDTVKGIEQHRSRGCFKCALCGIQTESAKALLNHHAFECSANV